MSTEQDPAAPPAKEASPGAYSGNPGEDFAVKSGGKTSPDSAESKPEESAHSGNPGKDFAVKSGEDYSPDSAESDYEGPAAVVRLAARCQHPFPEAF